MKILFHNYSNEMTTEPMYLSRAMNQCGLEASIWADPKVSAFDAFDVTKPEVFVSHAYTVNQDIFKYLTQEKNIDLVLNVTGLSDNQILELDDHLERSGVTCPFIFTNNFGYREKVKTKIPFHSIFPCADLFNATLYTGPKSIPNAFLTLNGCEELNREVSSKEGQQYHLLQVTNGKIDDAFDVRTNALSLKNLYHLYEQVTLVGNADFCSSQLFFDLSYNMVNVRVKCSDRDNFQKFLEEAFDDTDSGEDISHQLKEQIENFHTPIHRAATLCEYLKDQDGLDKINSIKPQLQKVPGE